LADCCKCRRYAKSATEIDPEKITRQGMIDAGSLNNRIRETGQPKARKQKAKCRDHRHNSKVAWRQQSGQDDCAEQLDQKNTTLSEYRDAGIANSPLR
jgi:hypothetical protein